MSHRRRFRHAIGGHLDQLAVAVMVAQADLRQRRTGAADLLGRRLDFGLAADDFLAVLVDAASIEQEIMVRAFFRHRHRRRDRVAKTYRPREL